MQKRPPSLRRSWMFLPGANMQALEQATQSGVDVAIQELEDFTPPELRPAARALSPALLRRWREAGLTTAVRINPLEVCGLEDLGAVMPGHPDVVMMAMVTSPDQVGALDRAITQHEDRLGLPVGSTEIVPNIETAAAVVRVMDIVAASPRVTAALLAAEDLAADLGAERNADARELAYARQRFLFECVAAGVVAIDCPCTFSDSAIAESDVRWARTFGYKAKSLVHAGHVPIIHAALTPSPEECAHAQALVTAFEAARAQGQDRALVGGHAVEVPTYRAAKRLLERHASFEAFAQNAG